MGLQPQFFRGMSKVLVILAGLGVVGAILCFIFIPGMAGRFYGIGALILVLNLGLMYLFIRVNDSRRPDHRQRSRGRAREEEPMEKRFDFRKRDR